VAEGAKNLAEVETRNEPGRREATETNLKSLLFNFAWWMKKQGYAGETVRCNLSALRVLVKRGADSALRALPQDKGSLLRQRVPRP